MGQDRLQHEQTLDDYQRFVARRIADGVQRAVNNLRPAEMAFGTAEAPEHVFNRRWFMQPGTVPPNPFGDSRPGEDESAGAGSPNLTEPAGPTDPTISLLAFREPSGGPISVFSGLLAALRGRRRRRRHLGRLLRHVLRPADAAAEGRRAGSAVRRA